VTQTRRKTTSTSKDLQRIADELRDRFERNGYIRPPFEKLRKGDPTGRFRRGFEFRLTADTRSELMHIRSLLRRAGFKPSRPFVKGYQYRQPVYGRAQLQRFLDLVGWDGRIVAKKV
jgi:hypothetical protein